VSSLTDISFGKREDASSLTEEREDARPASRTLPCVARRVGKEGRESAACGTRLWFV
jgi:hypothetical protein